MQNKLIGLVTDITGEDFEVPVYNADLENLIEESSEVYHMLSTHRNEKKMWRDKLNELISEYNDRRQMKVYNFIH